ncbi:MAG: hypothetical protein ACYDA9_03220 [Terriglobia bacterium]
MNKKIQYTGVFQLVALAIVVALVLPAYLSASKPKAKTRAQRLVEDTLQEHPETDEIGISVRSSRGCSTIASTDKSDIGEACEKDDLEPIRTGKPYVEKERDGYDVSVQLRDEHGQIVGSVGVGFKQAPGQTQAKAVEDAVQISKEMTAHIASKAALFQPAK